MKFTHATTIILFSLALLSNAPTEIIKADDVQKNNILKLEKEIALYHQEIQDSYKYIVQTGLIKNEKSRIPLRAHDIQYFTRKQEHLYNSELNIYWTGKGEIRFLEFTERIAINTTFQRKYRIWLGQKLNDSHTDTKQIEGYVVDFIAYLGLEYGNLQPMNYRVNTGFDSGNSTNFPEIPDIPIKKKVQTIYTQNPNQRIKILQEYLKLMQLAYLRINFFTRNARTGDEAKLEQLLP